MPCINGDQVIEVRFITVQKKELEAQIDTIKITFHFINLWACFVPGYIFLFVKITAPPSNLDEVKVAFLFAI